VQRSFIGCNTGLGVDMSSHVFSAFHSISAVTYCFVNDPISKKTTATIAMMMAEKLRASLYLKENCRIDMPLAFVVGLLMVPKAAVQDDLGGIGHVAPPGLAVSPSTQGLLC
jgi:hypothetical protein